MARTRIDCRTMPSERGCTVRISGEEDEVLELAAAHAVAAHGHTDGPALRHGLRAQLRHDDALELERGAFLQLIEYRTADVDQVIALDEEWKETIGGEGTARWSIVGADRDRPGTYVELVAFPDRDAAMRNSGHPATAAFAKKMQEAIDGEALFRNLDVHSVRRLHLP